MEPVIATPAPGADSPAPGIEAAGAVAPDPQTAEILARHSAGQKLSQREYGKLGAWKAKLAGFIPGRPRVKPNPAAGPEPARPDAPQPPIIQAAPGVPDGPNDSAALVCRTTRAILKTCDGIARRKVATEARKAGADDSTLRRIDSAVSMPAGAEQLMVESSPEVVTALGLDPAHYPIGAFLTGLGLWASNVWLAVDELKTLQAKQAKVTPAAVTAPAPVTPAPVTATKET